MKKKRSINRRKKRIQKKITPNKNHLEFFEKTILVVNTGSIKKKFIFQKLKKLGLKVIVLNKEKNWAQPYVDHWITSDTTDHKESLTAIEKFIVSNPDIKINGAITFWEDDVLLTSKIIDRFNFIGIPYHIAKQIRNKYLFREFCYKNKIIAPKHALVRSFTDLAQVEKFSFPLVVKPVFGAASAFVVKVENKEELKETFNYVRKSINTNVESALSDGLEIMIEEYIDGDEVDIDILLQNGKIKFFTISDNNQTDEPFFIETGRITPSGLPEKEQQQLIAMAEETLEKLNVQDGCIHFEGKTTKKGPVPLEVNLRMGGDEIYTSIKEAWGIDLVENAVKIALGIYIKIEKLDVPRKYIVSQDFLSNYSGIVIELDIDHQIKKESYVEEIHFFKQIGDTVFIPPDGYEYLGWITVSGDTLPDAQDNLREALEYISFNVAKFDPFSSIGKTSRKNRFSQAILNKDLVKRAAKIETIRRISTKNLRKLHVGIACNIYAGTDGQSEVEQDLMSVGKNIEKILEERGYKITFFDFNNLSKAFNDLRQSDVDMVFNVCERINDSSLLEPHAASILDTLQIPYTGSNPFTLALCIDKIRVKKLLTFHNIPTPKWDYAYTLDDEIDESLKYPLIVKPGNTDNSIGITNDSVVTNQKALYRQLEKIIVEIGRPALIEEYIEGDEYDVTILGSEEDDLRVLPLSQSTFENMPKGYWHIYPYEAKWTSDPTYEKYIIVHRPPKGISSKVESLISEIALDTYNILDCHDYGRVEIRVDENNNPYVLELNPNPSININDCVPACAELVGMDYGGFLEEIISLAIKRYKNKPAYYHLQTDLM